MRDMVPALNYNEEFVNFSNFPARILSNRNHSFSYLVMIVKKKGSKPEIN